MGSISLAMEGERERDLRWDLGSSSRDGVLEGVKLSMESTWEERGRMEEREGTRGPVRTDKWESVEVQEKRMWMGEEMRMRNGQEEGGDEADRGRWERQ